MWKLQYAHVSCYACLEAQLTELKRWTNCVYIHNVENKRVLKSLGGQLYVDLVFLIKNINFVASTKRQQTLYFYFDYELLGSLFSNNHIILVCLVFSFLLNAVSLH